MKLRKIFYIGSFSLVLPAVAGYWWLNSWRWGGTPEPHSCFTTEQAAILQNFDDYITGNNALSVLSRSMAETEDDAETMRLLLCCELRSRGGLLRRNLHNFIKTGVSGEPDESLLLLALDKQDFALIKLLVEKGLNPRAVAEQVLLSPKSVETMQKLMQTGAMPSVEVWLTTEFLHSSIAAYAPNPEVLCWLLSYGVDVNKIQGEMTESVLDTCLRHFQYMQREQGEEIDTLINSRLEELDLLLAHGAVCSDETKDFLPIDAGLRAELVSLFRKHGIEILPGAHACNACCSPD